MVEDNKKRVRIVVSGYVHGVLYRSGTLEKSNELGITGWVRNTPKGVEIVAEGRKESLEKLIKWCWQGPPFAKVGDVKVSWTDANGEFQDFQVKY